MNQKKQITYHTKQLEKIIESYGVGSDATIGGFFRLQGALMGLPEGEVFDYAINESDRLEKAKKAAFLKYHAV